MASKFIVKFSRGYIGCEGEEGPWSFDADREGAHEFSDRAEAEAFIMETWQNPGLAKLDIIEVEVRKRGRIKNGQ